MKRRVLHRGDTIIGQIKVLWWVTVKKFHLLSDAVKWLGYGQEEE